LGHELIYVIRNDSCGNGSVARFMLTNEARNPTVINDPPSDSNGFCKNNQAVCEINKLYNKAYNR